MRKFQTLSILLTLVVFLCIVGITNAQTTGSSVVTRVGQAPLDQKPVVSVPGGAPSQCSGAPVNLGYTKKLLPLPTEGKCSQTQTGACGRPGTCAVPAKIVLHTTAGALTADDLYNYFAAGSPSGEGYFRGVGSHFVVGNDGKILQMVESFDNKIEVAWAVANYSDHISIEMGYGGVYNNRGEVPPAQYNATLGLVKNLMKTYNIPLGNLEYNWSASSDSPTSQATPGVYGHYQLNPQTRTDPGSGLMRDFREDLKK